MGSNKKTPARKYLEDLCAKFKGAATLTLAKKAYAKYPQMWINLESCRQMVRACRGNHGPEQRRNAIKQRPDIVREPQSPGDIFGKLPEPKPQFDGEWCALNVEGQYRALVLQDLQIPFHDRAALSIALAHGKKMGCDLVYMNGDIADFFSVSDYCRDPRITNLAEEVSMVKQFLALVREIFPNARIIFKEGNHEERLFRYLCKKCVEVLDLPQFDIREVLGLRQHGIEFLGEMRPARLGKLYLIHGHEYRYNISNPVNPARGLFLRAKTMAAMGHLHQISSHQEKDISGKIIRTWSFGCLCDLRPSYGPLGNNWAHGFAIVDVGSCGDFDVQSLAILNGKVY